MDISPVVDKKPSFGECNEVIRSFDFHEKTRFGNTQHAANRPFNVFYRQTVDLERLSRDRPFTGGDECCQATFSIRGKPHAIYPTWVRSFVHDSILNDPS